MLRFGIIGTNKISEQFARAALSLEDVSLVNVYSRAEETGRAFASQFGIPAFDTDINRFLADPNMDAVYVASPNYLHAVHSKKALLYGKHVLCEKPVASSQAQFEDALETASEMRRIYLEAMRPLYDPSLFYVKKQMESIGKVRRAVLDFSQYSSRYDAFRRGEVLNAFLPSLENAALLDLGVYAIQWTLALFGVPSSVQSRSSFLDNGFEAQGSMIFSYPDGLQTVITYSKITEAVTDSTIAGEDGTIVIGGKLNSPMYVKTLYRDGREEIREFPDSPENMKYEILFFQKLVQQPRFPQPMIFFMRETTKLLDTIVRNNGICFSGNGNA